MKILIVEDNHTKLNSIMYFLKEEYPNYELDYAYSYTSGIRKIYGSRYSLIILDMSLPMYDINQLDSGGDKKSVAGKDIMKRMIHKKIIVPTLIITQFDTFGDNDITIDMLNKEFETSMSSIWIGTINYENIQWKKELSDYINNLSKGDK